VYGVYVSMRAADNHNLHV